jgi:hypothetical protein
MIVRQELSPIDDVGNDAIKVTFRIANRRIPRMLASTLSRLFEGRKLRQRPGIHCYNGHQELRQQPRHSVKSGEGISSLSSP